jgi:Na+-driven multidrug efflux pump
MLALSHSIAGVLRGAGKAKVPMFVMLGVWCIFRVTYISVAMSLSHTIELVFAAYPLTWTISSIIFIIYMAKSNWVHGLDMNGLQD